MEGYVHFLACLGSLDFFRQPVVLNLGPFSQAGEGFVMAYHQADAAQLVRENGRAGFRAVELFERLVVDQILQPVFRMLQRLPLIGDAVCRDTVRIRQFAVFYGNPLQFLVFFLRPVCIVRLPIIFLVPFAICKNIEMLQSMIFQMI